MAACRRQLPGIVPNQAFDTSVVDLTADVADPADNESTIQEGTNIASAVGGASATIEQLRASLFS